MRCCRNYITITIFLHLLTILSVGSQILIHITTNIFSCNAAWKESSRVSYPASAGICCDVVTCCIHGSQKGHLCMWLTIVYFPSPCWEKFLNGIKEWRVGWEELHQHPVMGSKQLPDDVGMMETDIVPNNHILWQVISNLTPFLFRDEIPVESV